MSWTPEQLLDAAGRLLANGLPDYRGDVPTAQAVCAVRRAELHKAVKLGALRVSHVGDEACYVAVTAERLIAFLRHRLQHERIYNHAERVAAIERLESAATLRLLTPSDMLTVADLRRAYDHLAAMPVPQFNPGNVKVAKW